MIRDRLTRRRLLAAAGTGLATALAGCGYQSGGGDLDWHQSGGSTGAPWLLDTSDERRLDDGEFVARVHNRTGRTHTVDGFVDVDDAHLALRDSSGELHWRASAPDRYVGNPAIADGRAYLHLEDDRIVSLERDESGDGDDDSRHEQSSTNVATRWETDWDGPALALQTAPGGIDSSLLVGTHRDGLVGFDIDGGDVRFELAPEEFDGRELETVAVADDGLWALSPGDRNAGREPVLFGIAPDGNVRTTVALPMRAEWLVAIGSNAVIGIETVNDSRVPELRAVTPAGERRFAIDLAAGSGGGAPIPVPETERLYRYAGGVLEAVDVASGELVWRHEDHSFQGTPVADADGVYGWGTGPEMDACGLTAITADGEPWWGVQPLEEISCRDELVLAGDRLVAVADDDLYGLYKGPGRRYTILS